MGGRQVLELVDQQDPGEALHLHRKAGSANSRSMAPVTCSSKSTTPGRPARPVAPGHPVEIGDVGHVRLDVAGIGEPQPYPAQGIDPGRRRVGLGPLGKGDQAAEQSADLHLLDRRPPPDRAQP